MPCPLYLAMTAAEFAQKSAFSHKVAWMSCHFSPFGRGLSNVPKWLPEGSLLMADDSYPPDGHDPKEIADQLQAAADRLKPAGIVLDFQRPGDAQTERIRDAILSSLPYPVAVALPYARRDFPVLLPPPPPQTVLTEYLKAYRGQEIWLEVGAIQICATVTEKGCAFQETQLQWDLPKFYDEALCCHYQTRVSKDSIQFLLLREKDDVLQLAKAAQAHGVTCCVGLYRELK